MLRKPTGASIGPIMRFFDEPGVSLPVTVTGKLHKRLTFINELYYPQVMRISIFLSLLILAKPCMSFNDLFFTNLEKKIENQNGQWFLKIINKRLTLDLESTAKPNSDWFVKLDNLLWNLRALRKISDQEYRKLLERIVNNCLVKTDSQWSDACVSHIISKIRNIYGSATSEKFVLSKKNSFLSKIEKNLNTDSSIFSFIFDSCLYFHDKTCLQKISKFYAKKVSENTLDDYLNLSMLYWDVGSKSLSEENLQLLLKKYKDGLKNINDTIRIISAYHFIEDCKNGLVFLKAISPTSEDVPIKLKTNYLLAQNDLLRICKEPLTDTNELESILEKTSQQQIYLLLKIAVEIAGVNQRNIQEKLLSLLKNIYMDLEKLSSPQMESARMQFLKIYTTTALEKQKKEFSTLYQNLVEKKDSESRYVIRLLSNQK